MSHEDSMNMKEIWLIFKELIYDIQSKLIGTDFSTIDYNKKHMIKLKKSHINFSGIYFK